MSPRRWSAFLLAAAVVIGCSESDTNQSPLGDDDYDDLGIPGKLDSGLGECSAFAKSIETGLINDPDLDELSGLAASSLSPGVLWTHNDKGSGPIVYAINRLGIALGTYELDVENLDWEDIAVGPGPDAGKSYVYLADIGDNDQERDSVFLHRFEEPALDPTSESRRTESVETETIELLFGDGRSHDAESLIVDPLTGDIIVITRARGRRDSEVYVAAGPVESGAPVAMALLLSEDDQSELEGRVIGADISPGGDLILVSFAEGNVRAYYRSLGESVINALSGRGCEVEIPDGRFGGVAIAASGVGFYLVEEGSPVDLRYVGPVSSCIRYDEAETLGVLDGGNAEEISGIAKSRFNDDTVWAHNDGPGNLLLAYGLDGSHRATFALDVEFEDWEDMAIGPSESPDRDYLYLADMGDNELERDTIFLHRVLEPQLEAGLPTEVTLTGVESFELYYGDGEAHDAETLIVDPVRDEIYIVTKSSDKDRDTRIFLAPRVLDPAEPNELLPVLDDDDAVELKGRVVAGDISADGTRVILTVRGGENRVWERHASAPIWELFQSVPCDAPSAEGQVESVSFEGDGLSYLMIPEGLDPPIFRVGPR